MKAGRRSRTLLTLGAAAVGLLAAHPALLNTARADIGDADPALRSFARPASAPVARQGPADPQAWERRTRGPDRLGPTPLRDGDLALLQALRGGLWAEALQRVKAGAAVNARDERGSHPLALAAAAGQDELVRDMVRRGAVLDRIGEDGFTPLGAAAWRGHRTTAQLLLRAGADPAAWGHNGHPPMHLAALAGHAELVEDFLRLGSPIELLNRARETALDVAANANQDRAMDLLIQGGADMTKAGRR
ncbi:MAG: ankyrin repeat domain-containing protein [Rubrivivax sp.]|nr:ankyrin repeat domain-containing protein [Rubrivivax sp.]